MTALLKIDDCEFTPARLTGQDVIAMTEAGVLPEGRGFELIEGVLVAMAAQQSPHVGALSAIVRFFNRNLSDDHDVAIGGSMYLSETNVLEPDICIYPMGMPSADVRGPDILLAIEISDTTLRYDLGKKAQLYAAHGVRDYWVADLNNRLIHRHSGPQPDGYESVTATGYDTPITVPFVPDLTFDPATVLR